MDDLRYLAEYAPECFEKTCKNVVYNVPESKAIMEPDVPKPQEEKAEVEAKRAKAIKDILVSLELGGTKKTLMDMLANLPD